MNDWSFALIYVAVLAVCMRVSKEGLSADILSPSIIFPVLLLAYSLASSLFVTQFGRTNFGYPVDDDILQTFYICVLLGLLGFFFGRYLSRRFPVWHLNTRTERSAGDAQISDKILVYALLSALVCAPFIYSSFNIFSQLSYSEQALAVRVESMGDANSGLKQVFLQTTPITLILCACSLLLFDRTRRVPVRLAAAFMISLNVIANLLAGWRGSVMATLGIVGIFYHYRVRRFRLSHFIAGSVLVYTLVNVMALVRVSSDPLEMIHSLSLELGTNSLAFLSLSKSGELLTGTNLMRQIGGIRDGELKYSFGGTIVDDFLVWVPRPLYPGRPLPSAEKFVEIFYPGVRDIGAGFGFFIIQEGHWVAGYIGAFAVLCGFGYVVYSVYWVFLSKRNSLIAVFAYALAFPALCVFSVRSGIVISFKAALINLVPLVILLLLPPIRPNRNAHELPPSSL